MRYSRKNTPLLKFSRHFTLLEVLVAISILALGLTTAMYVSGHATMQQKQAQDNWGANHLFANAAEFYLLFGHDSQIPQDFFPEGYTAKCEFKPIKEPESGMPEFAFEDEDYKGWNLVKYTITILDPMGNEMITKSINKVVDHDE